MADSRLQNSLKVRRETTKRTKERFLKNLKATGLNVTKAAAATAISTDRYYQWYNKDDEFKKKVAEVRTEYENEILEKCVPSLKKLIEGFEYDEKTTEYVPSKTGEPVIRLQRVVKKTVAPNLGAIIHYQTNKDADNWANKQRVESKVSIEIEDARDKLAKLLIKNSDTASDKGDS